MMTTTKSKTALWVFLGMMGIICVALGLTFANAMKSDEAYRQTPEYQRLAAENEGWNKMMADDTKARAPEQKASEDALIEYGKTH
jgi:hypothetical protein